MACAKIILWKVFFLVRAQESISVDVKYTAEHTPVNIVDLRRQSHNSVRVEHVGRQYIKSSRPHIIRQQQFWRESDHQWSNKSTSSCNATSTCSWPKLWQLCTSTATSSSTETCCLVTHCKTILTTTSILKIQKDQSYLLVMYWYYFDFWWIKNIIKYWLIICTIVRITYIGM